MKKQINIFGILLFFIATFFSLETKLPENSLVSKTPLLAAEKNLVSIHDTTAAPSEIISPSSAGEVFFPHLQHTEDFDVACKDCHHETNAAELNIPHEDYFDDFWIDCKICHHEGGSGKLQAQACSKCHHSNPANIADETLSSKVVIHKNCWECHEVGTGKEASESCQLCHSGERTKIE
jgi:hypothetical protein